MMWVGNHLHRGIMYLTAGDCLLAKVELKYEKVGFVGSDSAFCDRGGASGLPVLP